MSQTIQTTPTSDAEDILCHYGTEGMKWGVRRYQNPDGSLTPLGRLHYGLGYKTIGDVQEAARKKSIKKARKVVEKNRKEAVKKEKEEAKETKKAEKRAAKDEKAEKKRQKYVEKRIRSGDAEKIYKARGKMTDAELARALDRIKRTYEITGYNKKPEVKQMIQKLEKVQENRKTVSNGKEAIDGALKVIGTAVSVYQAYNKVAGMTNAIRGKDTLPTFDFNPWNKKDSANKNNKDSDDKSKNDGSSSTSKQVSNETTKETKSKDTTTYTWSNKKNSNFYDAGSGSFLSNVSGIKSGPSGYKSVLDSGSSFIDSVFDNKNSYELNNVSDFYFDPKEVYIMKHSDEEEDILCHYGIEGQKWGIRRYQNPDGSLTPAGRQRYGVAAVKQLAKSERIWNDDKKTAYERSANKGLSYSMTKNALKNAPIETAKAQAKVLLLKQKQEQYIKAYSDMRDKALKDLYADKDRFKKVVNNYVEEQYGSSSEADKKAYKDWFLYDDGWQDAAEDWYIKKYTTVDSNKNLGILKEARKELNSALDEYADAVLFTGDLGSKVSESDIKLAKDNIKRSVDLFGDKILPQLVQLKSK